MKKIFKIFQILIPTLLLGACDSEKFEINIGQESENGRGIPFTINLTNKTIASRAAYYTENGVTGYNENAINRADVFFYTDVNADAVHKVSKTWSSPQEQEAQVDGTIPSEIVESNNGNLYAYVIVNGPSTPGIDTDTKIAALKQIGIDADFTTFTQANGKTYSQTEFVMDGENTVTYDATAKKVSGTINLNRAASKIALFITNLEPFVDGEGNTWTPQTTGMSVSFYNGVDASRINVGAVNDCASGNYFSISDKANDTTDDARFSFATAASDNSETTNVDESKAYTHFPFYSYSSDWGRESNPDNEAYLSLRIYWQKEGAAAPEPYYYRVPINLEDYTVNGTTYPGKQLQRNTYYKVLLEVGVLGDKSENSQVTLTPNYIVVDWNDEPVEVQLADYHYLVVEKNFVEMFNEESVTIKYESCGNIKAEIVSISVPDFSTNTIGTINYTISDSNNDSNIFTVSKNTSGNSNIPSSTSALNSLLRECTLSHNSNVKEVTFTHELQNDNSTKPYDYAMYTIVVRFTTTDGCALSEDITIHQYPARYIEGELDYQKDDNWEFGGNGTVLINGHGVYDVDRWDRLVNTLDGSGYNGNPNMYVVTITSFNASQNQYIIADPRVTVIDNLDGIDYNWTPATAPAIDGTSRQLKYYYPTREDNPNIIAPKFRIVSAYARISGHAYSIKELQQRCAAYQEFGYPAGRWRLPTAAELNYIGQLSAAGVIPHLFTDRGVYNSANGAYRYSATTGEFAPTTSNTASTRCVYDEWYWTDKCDEYTFTWGDQLR